MPLVRDSLRAEATRRRRDLGDGDGLYAADYRKARVTGVDYNTRSRGDTKRLQMHLIQQQASARNMAGRQYASRFIKDHYQRKQQEDEEAVLDQWVENRYDLNDPSAVLVVLQHWPGYYERRFAWLAEEIDKARRRDIIYTLPFGAQTRGDAEYQYLRETGQLDDRRWLPGLTRKFAWGRRPAPFGHHGQNINLQYLNENRTLLQGERDRQDNQSRRRHMQQPDGPTGMQTAINSARGAFRTTTHTALWPLERAVALVELLDHGQLPGVPDGTRRKYLNRLLQIIGRFWATQAAIDVRHVELEALDLAEHEHRMRVPIFDMLNIFVQAPGPPPLPLRSSSLPVDPDLLLRVPSRLPIGAIPRDIRVDIERTWADLQAVTLALQVVVEETTPALIRADATVVWPLTKWLALTLWNNRWKYLLLAAAYDAPDYSRVALRVATTPPGTLYRDFKTMAGALMEGNIWGATLGTTTAQVVALDLAGRAVAQVDDVVASETGSTWFSSFGQLPFTVPTGDPNVPPLLAPVDHQQMATDALSLRDFNVSPARINAYDFRDNAAGFILEEYKIFAAHPSDIINRLTFRGVDAILNTNAAEGTDFDRAGAYLQLMAWWHLFRSGRTFVDMVVGGSVANIVMRIWRGELTDHMGRQIKGMTIDLARRLVARRQIKELKAGAILLNAGDPEVTGDALEILYRGTTRRNRRRPANAAATLVRKADTRNTAVSLVDATAKARRRATLRGRLSPTSEWRGF